MVRLGACRKLSQKRWRNALDGQPGMNLDTYAHTVSHVGRNQPPPPHPSLSRSLSLCFWSNTWCIQGRWKWRCVAKDHPLWSLLCRCSLDKKQTWRFQVSSSPWVMFFSRIFYIQYKSSVTLCRIYNRIASHRLVISYINIYIYVYVYPQTEASVSMKSDTR